MSKRTKKRFRRPPENNRSEVEALNDAEVQIPSRDRVWKYGFAVFVGLTILLTVVTSFFLIRIDPYGLWFDDVSPGYNNFKPAQDETERLFKIYQYRRLRPDVVFFGSSRVNYCTPAEWPKAPDLNVYNFGLNAVHIPEMKMYMDAAMRIHRPSVVVLGLDLLQFSKRFNDPREGFSAERLDWVRFSHLTAVLYGFRESVLSFDAWKSATETLEQSRENPEHQYYVRGWDSRASRRNFRWHRYRDLLWRYHRGTYRRFKWSRDNYQLLVDAVRSTRERGIEVVLYVNPVSVDFISSYDTNGIWRSLETMKRGLVAIGETWDFNHVNSVTTDRRRFFDPSHFYPDVGQRILSIVGGLEPPGDFGVLLNRANIDDELNRQRERFDLWRENNDGAYHLMKDSTGWKRSDENTRTFHSRAARVIR